MARIRGPHSGPIVVAFALILAVAGCLIRLSPSTASPGTEVEPSPDASTTSSAALSTDQYTVDGMSVKLV